MRAKVLVEFRDRNDFMKRYCSGEVISGFDAGYIDLLVSHGYVVRFEESADLKSELTGSPSDASEIDLSGQWKSVVAQIRAFGDAERLTQYYETEKAGENPRESVLKAIEDRIMELTDGINAAGDCGSGPQ